MLTARDHAQTLPLADDAWPRGRGDRRCESRRARCGRPRRSLARAVGAPALRADAASRRGALARLVRADRRRAARARAGRDDDGLRAPAGEPPELPARPASDRSGERFPRRACDGFGARRGRSFAIRDSRRSCTSRDVAAGPGRCSIALGLDPDARDGCDAPSAGRGALPPPGRTRGSTRFSSTCSPKRRAGRAAASNRRAGRALPRGRASSIPERPVDGSDAARDGRPHGRGRGDDDAGVGAARHARPTRCSSASSRRSDAELIRLGRIVDLRAEGALPAVEAAAEPTEPRKPAAPRRSSTSCCARSTRSAARTSG